MFESLIPRGKMGRPEEIATVALFLASDGSSFVNGVERRRRLLGDLKSADLSECVISNALIEPSRAL